MRWYVVPRHTNPDSKFPPIDSRPAEVVNQYGEMIAVFETLRDAQIAVDLYNNSVKEVA